MIIDNLRPCSSRVRFSLPAGLVCAHVYSRTRASYSIFLAVSRISLQVPRLNNLYVSKQQATQGCVSDTESGTTTTSKTMCALFLTRSSCQSDVPMVSRVCYLVNLYFTVNHYSVSVSVSTFGPESHRLSFLSLLLLLLLDPSSCLVPSPQWIIRSTVAVRVSTSLPLTAMTPQCQSVLPPLKSRASLVNVEVLCLRGQAVLSLAKSYQI